MGHSEGQAEGMFAGKRASPAGRQRVADGKGQLGTEGWPRDAEWLHARSRTRGCSCRASVYTTRVL